MELPDYTPSPKTSIATWIDRVDLRLRSAVGLLDEVSDRMLFAILGNKLREEAADEFVSASRQLLPGEQTWTNLKERLQARFGERLDSSAAIWRVHMRAMMPGETFADYAAALRKLVGRNAVGEDVLLGQFYRNLEKLTRQLVQLHPQPRTIEEAATKATQIDDPMENVAQGMQMIGQAWATAPSPYVIPMAGTTGATTVIPGVSLAADTYAGSGATARNSGAVAYPLFTNPRGVWNKYSGTWDIPEHHTWNGRFWAPKKSRSGSSAGAGGKSKVRHGDEPLGPDTKRARVSMAVIHGGRQSSSAAAGDDEQGRPASGEGSEGDGSQASGRVYAVTSRTPSKAGLTCYTCGERGHMARDCAKGPECYACHRRGHFARDCVDKEARARNDEYLRSRPAPPQDQPGNAPRT